MLSELEVRSYWLRRGESGKCDVSLDAVFQLDGKKLWAVRSAGNCLARDGFWEEEPAGSSRTTAFLRRCRFADTKAALAAWQKHLENIAPKGE